MLKGKRPRSLLGAAFFVLQARFLSRRRAGNGQMSISAGFREQDQVRDQGKAMTSSILPLPCCAMSNRSTPMATPLQAGSP